jgi:hypothetical protein
MKTLAAKSEQFLTDAKGKRTGVLLDLQTGVAPMVWTESECMRHGYF